MYNIHYMYGLMVALPASVYVQWHEMFEQKKGKPNEKYALYSSKTNKNVIDLALLMKFTKSFVYLCVRSLVSSVSVL